MIFFFIEFMQKQITTQNLCPVKIESPNFEYDSSCGWNKHTHPQHSIHSTYIYASLNRVITIETELLFHRRNLDSQPRVDCRIISTSWIHIDRIVIAWIASRGRNIQRGHRVLLLESWSQEGIIVFIPRVVCSLRVQTHLRIKCDCLRSKCGEKNRKNKGNWFITSS